MPPAEADLPRSYTRGPSMLNNVFQGANMVVVTVGQNYLLNLQFCSLGNGKYLFPVKARVNAQALPEVWHPTKYPFIKKESPNIIIYTRLWARSLPMGYLG